ncbi:MAG: endolytic transglycosylase MltG [Patescibacteria group bacterium]|nr:endolytic transglycosylase MltG [Patescibacteria group bacterium]
MKSVKHIFSHPLFRACLLFGIISVGVVFSLPSLLALNVRSQEEHALPSAFEQFPVTVDPRNKIIVENAQVNAFLDGASSPLQAASGNAGDIFWKVFTWVATGITEAPWYRSIAAADNRFVTVVPGMRKEQVADEFANALGWNAKQKSEFLTRGKYSSLPLAEGSFAPGTYLVSALATPIMAQAFVNDRFGKDVLAHYGTTTAQMVPLDEALTIASLIERETGGPEDMRLISGVIWNRLFINMNIQIDATLQYAKADRTAAGSWWPRIVPADRFIKSPYNTYLHSGLPPTPIASPSVAAILAALNPVKTSCLFYFHDASGKFHCSDTYAEHVALLKQYYGRGK